MSKYDIKPNTQLTKQQRKVLLERAMSKEPLRQPTSEQPQALVQMPQVGPFNQMPEQPNVSLKAKPLAEATVGIPEAGELMSIAMQADQLWKDMGGSRSLAGKLWEMYHTDSGEPHSSSRDYFISNFVRWRSDPVGYAKKKPREANLLQMLSKELEASFGPSNPLDRLPPKVELS